jgi:hypothetical protein
MNFIINLVYFLQLILTKRKSKSLDYNSYNLENGNNHFAVDYNLYSYDGNEGYSKSADDIVVRIGYFLFDIVQPALIFSTLRHSENTYACHLFFTGICRTNRNEAEKYVSLTEYGYWTFGIIKHLTCNLYI